MNWKPYRLPLWVSQCIYVGLSFLTYNGHIQSQPISGLICLSAMKAPGRPHKAIVSLLNRSSIWKSFGYSEVASGTQPFHFAFVMFLWLPPVPCFVTIYSDIQQPGPPSRSVFAPPGFKPTASLGDWSLHEPRPLCAHLDFWHHALTKPWTEWCLAPVGFSHLSQILGDGIHSQMLGYLRLKNHTCVYDSWSPIVQIIPRRQDYTKWAWLAWKKLFTLLDAEEKICVG